MRKGGTCLWLCCWRTGWPSKVSLLFYIPIREMALMKKLSWNSNVLHCKICGIKWGLFWTIQDSTNLLACSFWKASSSQSVELGSAQPTHSQSPALLPACKNRAAITQHNIAQFFVILLHVAQQNRHITAETQETIWETIREAFLQDRDESQHSFQLG